MDWISIKEDENEDDNIEPDTALNADGVEEVRNCAVAAENVEEAEPDDAVSSKTR